jgi:hypothetical protein
MARPPETRIATIVGVVVAEMGVSESDAAKGRCPVIMRWAISVGDSGLDEMLIVSDGVKVTTMGESDAVFSVRRLDGIIYGIRG